MEITYDWFETANARCRFARMTAEDRAWLREHLVTLMMEIAESSVKGTEEDRVLWSVCTEQDRELWGRAQRHKMAHNNMLSVMAGAVAKLRGGGDLTERQFTQVKLALEVLTRLKITEPVTFTESLFTIA